MRERERESGLNKQGTGIKTRDGFFFYYYFSLQYMNSHFVKQFLALAEKCLSVGHFSRSILITKTYPCIPGNICKYVLNLFSDCIFISRI